MPSLPPLFRLAAAAVIATTLWLPSLRALHTPGEPGELADALLASERDAWSAGSPDDVAALRATNPEWDFMRRTFLALSLANRALARPEDRAASLALMDRVIDDTLARDGAHGHDHWLLPYAHRAPFEGTPGGAISSLFVDGEIAMMLAARIFVAPRPDLDAELDARAARIVAQMESSPALSGESYPNECWTFCNTFALAALRTMDAARGTDAHRELAEAWLAHAREHLVDEATGLLVSSYTWTGEPLDGPEGSSLFVSAHNLSLVDEAFARDQWVRARRELVASVAGFGYAREWPRSWTSRADVDSGPIVPLVEASAGASGLAILGARAFDDDETARALHASLGLAAFPVEREGRLRHAAGNSVGDAALLYAESEGPLFARVRERLARRAAEIVEAR